MDRKRWKSRCGRRPLRYRCAVRAAALLFAGGLFAAGAAGEAVCGANLSHGTSGTAITEDMLDFYVPEDYALNPETQGRAQDGEYNRFFKKDELQTIRIEVDENNLNYLFQHAIEKPSVLAERVTIGDTAVQYVGLKTKGSYTLDHSVSDNPDSDRFSLTINFGKYIKKKQYGETQNFFGANKISLNNFFFDKSMLKEFCALTLFSEMGLPTPQFGLTKLYINGDYYGVYFMVEALDESILEQYYQCGSSAISSYLCKPEYTRFCYEDIAADAAPLWEWDESTYNKVSDMLPTVVEWVRKLNLLAEGKDFEGNAVDVNSDAYLELLAQVMDVDEAVRYFAVHSFLCQTDNMFVNWKNFGLYVDAEGRSLLIPWDYDLSFGCYAPGEAEATANYDIDLMYIPDWNQTNLTRAKKAVFYKDFPLFYVIFQNDALMERYHTYMKDCAKVMALGGTTSLGTSYAPAHLYDMIETVREPLLEAAQEERTARAGYMNGIRQPHGTMAAVPNLEKIIAMRAVGVYTQVEGIDTYISGRGCNLATLGNAMESWRNLDYGTLTAVNAATGFFVTADYKGDVPELIVERLDHDAAAEALAGEVLVQFPAGTSRIYSYKVKGTAEGAYRLTVPLEKAYRPEKGEVSFYFSDGAETALLTAVQDENLYTVETEKQGFLIICVRKTGTPLSGIGQKLLFLAAFAAVVCLAAALGKRRRIS